MPPNLTAAIYEFLANEFKLDPKAIGDDLSFTSDLGLDPSALSDLLARLQEALDFTFPEDKIGHLDTIEDLLHLVDPQSPVEVQP